MQCSYLVSLPPVQGGENALENPPENSSENPPENDPENPPQPEPEVFMQTDNSCEYQAFCISINQCSYFLPISSPSPRRAGAEGARPDLEGSLTISLSNVSLP